MPSLLTVIVPTYNHEQYIARALDSILCQQTNFDFDIWILDDASTGGTGALCEKYTALYPQKIRVFRRAKNLGVMKNLHDGFSRLTAKYFAYLEGDDYWCDESKLQLQVDALEANPDCSMCGHDTLVKDWGHRSGMVVCPKHDGTARENQVLASEQSLLDASVFSFV